MGGGSQCSSPTLPSNSLTSPFSPSSSHTLQLCIFGSTQLCVFELETSDLDLCALAPLSTTEAAAAAAPQEPSLDEQRAVLGRVKAGLTQVGHVPPLSDVGGRVPILRCYGTGSRHAGGAGGDLDDELPFPFDISASMGGLYKTSYLQSRLLSRPALLPALQVLPRPALLPRPA